MNKQLISLAAVVLGALFSINACEMPAVEKKYAPDANLAPQMTVDPGESAFYGNAYPAFYKVRQIGLDML